MGKKSNCECHEKISEIKLQISSKFTALNLKIGTVLFKRCKKKLLAKKEKKNLQKKTNPSRISFLVKILVEIESKDKPCSFHEC